MKKIRIAVAGAGLIGRRHIELIRQRGDCELAAIVDPAPAAEAFARATGVPVYKTLAGLFASECPHGVIAATPNSLHVQNGVDCVAHGVPVLIEKPVADSVEDARRLIDAAERAKVPVLVGHHRRHSPILAKAREIVGEGALGRIVAVMGSAMFYKPDSYFDEGPWRRAPGGGPILINMIHEVDDLRLMCGEIVEVQALASNAIRGFPVEDTVALNLRFAGGALGTFLLSDTAATARSWEQTSGENSSYASYPDEDCYVIAGVSGSLAVPSMRLKVYAGERSWWKPFETSVVAVQRADPLSRQLEHFCSVVRGEATPLVSARDALQTLRVTLAIDESARTRRPVATIAP
ncbi:MAG: Gfo/Idh/MocA family oxidoreductase [Pseudomonadota bacterium]|nr:Gfo/Idh/MocA family oxidoreductase [Pseudomonadota bacterium]